MPAPMTTLLPIVFAAGSITVSDSGTGMVISHEFSFTVDQRVRHFNRTVRSFGA